ncbi:MAG: sialate O-acetylesterase [Pedobacter sp.]|nr:sialate O-acetylesterase [Pedobacter sp.]
MKWATKLIGFLMLLMVSTQLSAKILLPQILSSNMVLQRNKAVVIWGYAAPGEKVNVRFAGQTKNTTTTPAGTWEVTLDPLKTSSVPQSMFISGSNKIELTNILIGEVWVCSGQSNMEYAMRKLAKIPKPLNEKLGFPKDEVAQAKNPNIRIFLVNRKTLAKPDSLHQSWSVARESALKAFSAVGYFYAKTLQEKLGIPIGMIETAVSGSAIEPWIAKDALLTEDYFKDKKLSNDPGKFYDTMVEPMSKFKIRGFLWYQGETNCFLNETISYAYKMKTLIKLWRTAWQDQNAPFYYVQIAPYNYSKHSGQVALDENTEPTFWEAQAELLRMPQTGMIATTDLNDNGEDLHPTYKWVVGKRLAMLSLAKTYGNKTRYSGPVFSSLLQKDNSLILKFGEASGLEFQQPNLATGFEIAGADGKFYDATAKLIGNTVVLNSPMVKNPICARYNWTETPKGTLANTEGWLALPFRTDNPLHAQFKIN